MPNPPPAWVQALKPAGPQGSELLQQERAQSNVAVEKLSELLHTKADLDRQQQILNILQREKVFDKSQNHSLGRVERIQRSLAKGKRRRREALRIVAYQSRSRPATADLEHSAARKGL